MAQQRKHTGISAGAPVDWLLPLLLCLGLALLFNAEWSGKSYFQPQDTTYAVLVSELVNIVAFALCVGFNGPFRQILLIPRASQRVALVAVGIAAAAGRALLTFAGQSGTLDPLAIVGIALHSLCEPMLLLAFHFVLSRSMPRLAATILPASFMIAGAIMVVGQTVAVLVNEVLVVVGPLFAALLLIACSHLAGPVRQHMDVLPENERAEDDSPDMPAQAPTSKPPLWPFALMVGYDFVYHVITVLDTQASSFGMAGLIAMSAVALAVALVQRDSYSPLFLNKTALPFIVAALMCVTMSGLGQSIAALLSNAGSAAFYLFSLITFIMMCQRREYDPVRSVGMLLAFEHVGHFTGDVAGLLILGAFPQGGDPMQFAAMVIAVLMVVIATVFYNDLEVTRIFGLVPSWTYTRTAGQTSEAVVSVMTSREKISWQCALAARTYSLTIREEEVLELMLLDMTNAQIAEKMTLSVGTVKTHVSHVCRKLGVPGRAEAIEAARQLS